MKNQKKYDLLQDQKVVVESGRKIITDVKLSDMNLSVSKELQSNSKTSVIRVNQQLINVNDDQVRMVLDSSGVGGQIKFPNFKREGNLYVLHTDRKKAHENKNSDSDGERKIILIDF